jgi:hypothetical protein
VYGDFRRLHRMEPDRLPLPRRRVAAQEIELAAHKLLQYLDAKVAR